VSKFKCQCGHIIATAHYPNSVEGWLYGIEAEEEFDSQVADSITAYFAAKKKEERARWIETFFSKDYPEDCSDSEIVTDIIRQKTTPYLRDVLECAACGRLHVQIVPGENRYRSYRSEEGDASGILKIKKEPNRSSGPTAPSGRGLS
jgi:hypothetical protein